MINQIDTGKYLPPDYPVLWYSEENVLKFEMSLKDKCINFLKENPGFLDMEFFLRETGCGTVGCLAGLIVHVSGTPVHKPNELSHLEPELQNFPQHWLDFKPDKNRISNIPIMARVLWEKEYGTASAEKLPFYVEDWGAQFYYLSPKALIAKLNELVP